eukprot:TRINITY_DN26898_c0_g1_i1.p1 TRINITY_DN26898_c0_g1~~TRINITY_DN26898_c0_g1_i1.p1  ORF type:complete len:505 (+),score=18.87 TRINITY_DN26898_c0_g1_i1:45-1517(+)
MAASRGPSSFFEHCGDVQTRYRCLRWLMLLAVCCSSFIWGPAVTTSIGLLRKDCREQVSLQSSSSCFFLSYSSSRFMFNKKALPPVHWQSSWLANQWVPPDGYRTYSSSDIVDVFSTKSVLVLGDSTARRFFGTWYALMNATNARDITVADLNAPRVVDVNKKKRTETCEKEGYELCRPMPGATSDQRCDLHKVGCLSHVARLLTNSSSILRREMFRYDLVLFVLGPWEVSENRLCLDDESRRSRTESIFSTMMQLSSSVEYRHTSFVWRTWGSHGSTFQSAKTSLTQWAHAQSHNHLVKSLVHKYQKAQFEQHLPWSQVSYIDWGQVMSPRLFPVERRIAGDIDAHVGLEARVAFIQMLTNHLVEQERQVKSNLTPWIVARMQEHTSEGTKFDSDSDCLESGGSETYCLTPKALAQSDREFLELKAGSELRNADEIDRYEQLKKDFCPSCRLGKQSSCHGRMMYLMERYNASRLKALESIMKDAACRIR